MAMASGRVPTHRLLQCTIAATLMTQGAFYLTPKPAVGSEEARDLLAHVYENLYADNFIQTLEITTLVRGERRLVGRLQVARRQDPRPGRALVRFLEPPDIRKTALLLIENEVGYDDLYLFLPAFEMVRRVSAAQRADSFFGTDLSFEDLEPKHIGEVGVELLGEGAYGALPCVRVRTRAIDGVESMYERVESCIERRRPVILWSDFYRRGNRVKRLEVDPESIRPVGRRWIPFRFRIQALGKGSETIVTTHSYELHAEIPDGVFTTSNLQFGEPEMDRRRSGAWRGEIVERGAKDPAPHATGSSRP